MSCALAAAFAAQTSPAPVAAEDGQPATRKLAFYVVTDSDRATALGLVSLGVADELNKSLTNNFGAGKGRAGANPDSHPADRDVWVIPEPSWTPKDLLAACSHDENALGGVIVSAYSGYATHFWLLWQTETTTFTIFAQIVSCNYPPERRRRSSPLTAPSPQGVPSAAAIAGAQVVSIIAHLPGAGNSTWVVRRTQTSIPLLTLAAVGTVLSKNTGSNGKTSNLTLTAIAGSLFTSAGSKDIPGYSDPVRLRSASQHIGVDVVDSMKWLCSHPDSDGGIGDAHPGSELCQALRFPQPGAATPPASAGADAERHA